MAENSWRIESVIESFIDKPTNRQVLERLFYALNLKKTVISGVSLVAQEIQEIYSPEIVSTVPTLKKKINRLYEKYNYLKKNVNRDSRVEETKRNDFSTELNQLFNAGRRQIVSSNGEHHQQTQETISIDLKRSERKNRGSKRVCIDPCIIKFSLRIS